MLQLVRSMLPVNFFLVLAILMIGCSGKVKGIATIPAEAKAGNDEQSISLDLSRNHPFYDELRKHYDNIELRYIRGKNYTNAYGWKYFILERLSYYGIKNNIEYLLGYVTKDGVYDRNSNLLKKVEPPVNLIIMGISSETLEAPWGPSCAVKDTLRKNEIGNTNPFVRLKIDFNNNTLMTYIPDY